MSIADINCTVESVAGLCAGLFPTDVDIVPCEDFDQSTASSVSAVYRDNDGTVIAVFQTDLEFACRAGAAIALIPSNVCTDAIADKELSGTLRENAKEIMNIFSTLISTNAGTRAYLSELVAPDEPLPEDAAAMIESNDSRVSLKATIGNYGDGVLTFMT